MKESALLSQIIDLKVRVESFQTEIDAINHFINQAAQTFRELNARTDLPAEFGSLKLAFESHVKNEKSEKASQNSVIQEAKALTTSQNKSLESLNQNLQENTLRLSEVEKKFDLLNESIVGRNATIWNDVNNKFYDMSNAFNKILHSFKDEIAASPKSILETNQDIIKKCESTSVDCENMRKQVNHLDFTVRKLRKEVEICIAELKNR